MRLRPTHLFEHDTADVAFHLGCRYAAREPARQNVCRHAPRCGKIGGHALLRGRPDRPGNRTARRVGSSASHARTRRWSRPRPSHPRRRPPHSRCRPIRGWARCSSAEASLHTCTGAVLHSAAGDLILTAAHCVAEGLDATFVAGLNDTAAPEDVWHIDAVYLDPRWVQNQDPLADFAIARVQPRHRRNGGGAGRRWSDARARPETGHRRHRHRLRDGRRRRPDRLPDGHGDADERLSGAGLRRVGRRPVGRARGSTGRRSRA